MAMPVTDVPSSLEKPCGSSQAHCLRGWCRPVIGGGNNHYIISQPLNAKAGDLFASWRDLKALFEPCLRWLVPSSPISASACSSARNWPI